VFPHVLFRSKQGNEMNRISLARPNLAGREREYVLDCMDTSWISSIGKYIGRFEEAFAEFCGANHAIATNNGTTALHLALVGLGVGPGDEVLVPTLTYIATANAVTYCGATPVFVDSEPDTLGIDPHEIERHITPRTRGVIAVHLYGHPADMIAINAVASRHGLWVLEDAAEAHGARVGDLAVGAIGDCATFSFFGNKIVTTGEGGMVTTNDPDLANRLRLFRGQGMDPERRYWFPVVGYNYRMTNIQAAIGVAQMENISQALEDRARIATWYDDELRSISGQISTLGQMSWANRVFWSYNVFLTEGGEQRRDSVMALLDSAGIETRPIFYPMHIMPPYRSDDRFPVAESVSSRGITIPMHQGLQPEDVNRIARSLTDALSAT
jgi:perosamine synthetase